MRKVYKVYIITFPTGYIKKSVSFLCLADINFVVVSGCPQSFSGRLKSRLLVSTDNPCTNLNDSRYGRVSNFFAIAVFIPD